MKPRLKASAAAIALIKGFEGYRATAAQLVDGGWTIGYGHTKTARADVSVSPEDAEALLLYDLVATQAVVDETVFTPLTQNQFDALVAFAFNIGPDNFRRSSVLRRVNEGNMVQAACAIEMWRKADLDGERIVVDALVRRRAAEKALFLTPANGWTPVPSPIVRPRVDYDVALSMPSSTAEVSVSMNGAKVEAHRMGAAELAGLAEAEAGLDLAPPPASPLEDADAPQLPEPPTQLQPQPEEAFEPQAQPEPEADVEPASEALPVAAAAEDTAENLADVPSDIAADASRRIVRREAPLGAGYLPLGDDKIKLANVPLLAVGLAGMAVFAGSVFWGVNAKGPGGGLDPMVVASVLGLVGIALVAGAVYFLLVRLGGRED